MCLCFICVCFQFLFIVNVLFHLSFIGLFAFCFYGWKNVFVALSGICLFRIITITWLIIPAHKWLLWLSWSLVNSRDQELLFYGELQKTIASDAAFQMVIIITYESNELIYPPWRKLNSNQYAFNLKWILYSGELLTCQLNGFHALVWSVMIAPKQIWSYITNCQNVTTNEITLGVINIRNYTLCYSN